MRKIAAIDIGSNSFHLIIAQPLPNGKLEIIYRDREVLRLSENFIKGSMIISEPHIKRSVTVLRKFISAAEQYDAEIFAVATSSVRESSNQNEFLRHIFDYTGIKIKVINGDDESKLIYSGIVNSINIHNKKCLCVDIGGGSTEFIYAENNNIISTESIKIGAVRLTQKFFPDFMLNENLILACKNWVENKIFELKNKLKGVEIDCFIGTSGTVLTIGNMLLSEINRNLDGLNNFKISKIDLSKIEQIILSAETLEERKKIVGLDEKRADVFPAGIIILSTIFEQFKIKEMIISEYAMREGIIFDVLKNTNSSYL